MKTTTIILAVALIVLMGVAVLLIIRYLRKLSSLDVRAAELDEQEKGIDRRHKALDRWQAELKEKDRRQKEWDEARKHIYANFEILDSDENKPTMKSVGKSLSSKIGYALRKEFPEIVETRDDKKGRTVYSVDFYVTPYNDER